MRRWIANRLNDAGLLEDGLMMDKLPLLVIQLNTVFVVNDYRSNGNQLNMKYVETMTVTICC